MLDIGCGTGMLTKTVSERGFDVIGLGVSYASLRILRRNEPRSPLVEADAAYLPIDTGYLRGAVCLGVWRHFRAQQKVLDELTSVLLRDGSFIIGYFPPAIGGLVHPSQSRVGGLLVRLYNLLISRLGYIDRADNSLEQETETALEQRFNAAGKIRSGTNWRILLGRQPLGPKAPMRRPLNEKSKF